MHFSIKGALFFGGFLGLALGAIQIYRLEKVPDSKQPDVTFAELLRPRVNWPCDVIVTEPFRVKVIEGISVGFVEINPGRTIKATGLTEDGLLIFEWSGIASSIPIESTNFYQLAIKP